MDDGTEVHAEDRFTWERIVMRARLDGVIAGSGKVSERTGKQTRGGVSGAVFKAVALVFAAHADEDGTAIRPGDMRVAILAEVHPRTVKAVREKLIELGLIRQTGRYRHTPMYRLTLPSDLTELVVVLTPTEVVDTAKAMRSKARESKAKSRNGCTAGVPNEELMGVPPDHPKPPDGGPDGPGNGCTAGAPEIPNGCAAGQDMGVPPDTLNQAETRHLKSTIPTDDEDFGAAGHPSRATAEEPPNPDSSSRPAKCPTHGLGGGLRPDGLPECTFCRREQRTGSPDPYPPPNHPARCDHTPLPGKDRCRTCAAERVAPVIRLDSRRVS
jgi:hypothetical protein